MRKTLMLTAGVLTIMGAVTAGAMARGDFEHHGKHHGFHGKHGYHHDGGWGRSGRHGKGHHRLHRKLAKLKKLDADGDGVVTMEEYLKPKEERFAELDTSGNGSLSGEQLVAWQQAELDYRVQRMLKRYDTDGDGKISKEEFQKPARDRFAERDFNGDGKITDDELPPRFGRGDRNRGDDAEDADDRQAEASDDSDREEAREHKGKRHREGRWHRGHHHGGKGWRGRHARDLDDVLKRADRRFARMDKNNDGVIDKDEIGGRRAERIAYKQKLRMHVLDTNKDGSVSKDEYLAKSKSRFSMMDLNGDGKVTVDDLPPRAARYWEKKADAKDQK